MFGNLFTPRYATSSLFPDGMDMHTHILWGVDDGAACLEESLGIIRRLKAMGLKGAYCTPHIMARYPDNTPDFLRRRFDQLLADTREEQFQLRLAAEYMLDNQFHEQLRRYTPLTYDGIHLLVELPQYYLPGAWKDMISSVRDMGYVPVLAPPATGRFPPTGPAGRRQISGQCRLPERILRQIRRSPGTNVPHPSTLRMVGDRQPQHRHGQTHASEKLTPPTLSTTSRTTPMSAPTTNIPFSNPLYRNHNFYRRYGKRALDFTGALFGLICLFPVLAILAILLAIVQRTSPFFLQKRIGHGLKPFHIIKFKTMKDTRDKEGNLLPDEERTTVLGSLLRSTSLDELPELINVLLGDMSFIGPRPWIPDQMAIFNPSTRKKRMSLRPGITGLAQIRGRNNLTFRQRVCYDLSYQRHLTFRYDLNILCYTFLKVVEREGIQQRPDALSTPARVLKPRDLMTYGLKENTQLILRSIRKEPVPSLSVPAHPLTPKDLPTKGLRANTQLIMRSRQKSVQ